MKKQWILLFFVIICICSFPKDVYAFQHGYQRQTDDIYALARRDLAVYYDNSGEDLIEYIPAFTGIKVINSTSSWREIEYSIKQNTKTGWITKDDFYSDCLIYDGREKQILADGSYKFTYQKSPSYGAGTATDTFFRKGFFGGSSSGLSLSFSLTYADNNRFFISRTDTEEYLVPDSMFHKKQNGKKWGSFSQAGLFTFKRKGSYYSIQDASTNRFLEINEKGLLHFHNQEDHNWRSVRTSGKVLGSSDLRLFAQYDPEWADDYYGRGKNDDPSSNNFCTSGCGIFSTMNAIYTLTGHYADPHLLADYAVKKNYRIEDNGTDSEFFHAFALKYGYQYGFKYDGASGSLDTVKKKLKKGDTVIVHVPGHYVTIVDYNKKTNKFLLLDSHYLPKRETSPYGDWVDKSYFEEGNLYGYMYYFYKFLDH